MATSTNPKALLLDKYHRKVAVSQLPNGYAPYFQLGKIQWGFDLIDESGPEDLIKDIPADKESLEAVFATGDAQYTYINGVIVITAVLPVAQLSEGQDYRWSAIGILDNDDELVGVTILKPQNVNSGMSVAITLRINTVDNTAEVMVE